VYRLKEGVRDEGEGEGKAVASEVEEAKEVEEVEEVKEKPGVRLAFAWAKRTPHPTVY